MPFADGFAVVEALRSNPPHMFSPTAYAEYAIKAFRANACDYLLKPVNPEELRASVNKVKAGKDSEKEMLKRIEMVEQQLPPLGEAGYSKRGRLFPR